MGCCKGNKIKNTTLQLFVNEAGVVIRLVRTFANGKNSSIVEVEFLIQYFVF